MLASIRPYATAGVALIGASVIAVAPVVAPPIPDIKVPAATQAASPTVALSAFENPIEVWLAVLGATVDNLGRLGGDILANPAPILEQLGENQLANLTLIGEGLQLAAELAGDMVTALPSQLESVFTELLQGNIEQAMTNLSLVPVLLALPLLGLLAPPIAIATNATQNFANVVATLPDLLGAVALPALGPILGPVQAFGASAQAVFDAVIDGDYVTAFSALINTPAAMVDTFLNDSFGGIFGEFGLISKLLDYRETVAEALEPVVVTVGKAGQGDPTPMVEDIVAKKQAEVTQVDQVTFQTEAMVPLSTETDTPIKETPVDDVENKILDTGEPLNRNGLQTLSGNTTGGYIKDSLTATPGETGLSGGTNTGGDNSENSEAESGDNADSAGGSQNVGGETDTGAATAGAAGDDDSDSGGGESGDDE